MLKQNVEEVSKKHTAKEVKKNMVKLGKKKGKNNSMQKKNRAKMLVRRKVKCQKKEKKNVKMCKK